MAIAQEIARGDIENSKDAGNIGIYTGDAGKNELWQEAIIQIGDRCISEHWNYIENDLQNLQMLRSREIDEKLPKEERFLLEKLGLIELENILNEIEIEETKEEGDKTKNIPSERILRFFRLITYGNITLKKVPRECLQELLQYIPRELYYENEMEEFKTKVKEKKLEINVFSH